MIPGAIDNERAQLETSETMSRETGPLGAALRAPHIDRAPSTPTLAEPGENAR